MSFNLASTFTNKSGHVIKEAHHIRLKKGQEPPIYIQNNAFWYEDGSEIKNPPEWVFSELEKCDKNQLKAVNFTMGVKANGSENAPRNMADKRSA